MQKVENKQYSFYELLNIVGVKIPIIQRDYAQGREKAKDIRDRFLNRLFEVLNDNKTINLDFVYGTVKKKFLIPLDGQQRLTTLFLLHYYLGLKESKNIEFLQKFTYDIRLSSREFCNLLIEKKVYPKEIKNQTWFFSEWENDPTIKSMLVMLDSIEEKFESCNNCFDKLNNITFSFLNLEDFKLTDELYIKMNARGKPLTTFENFKAEFEKFIKDETIKAKLDNEWLDIFWNLREKENLNSVDDKYLNFFRNITLFFTEFFRDKKLEEVDVLKFKYKEDDICQIIETLDCLIGYQDNRSIFKNFITTKPTYSERARFYALMQFFKQLGDPSSNQKEFKSYMRVSLNLIENMVDSFENFKDMIRIIDELSIYLKDDFYKKLSTSDISKSYQFQEEREKADLICQESAWEDEFIEAEEHLYLTGQIGFLIQYANSDFDIFIEYRDRFIKLWNFTNNEKNNENEILIHRALLAIEDYLPKHRNSNKSTFCLFDKSLRIKNENWRKVFGEEYFQILLDKLDQDKIENSLKEIINGYQFDCNDWKSYFINPNKDWEIISYAKNYQILWENKDRIYLNRGSVKADNWNWRRDAELYSYYFFKKNLENNNFDPFKETWYYDSSSGISCAVLGNFEYQDNIYIVEIIYNQEFKILFYEKNKKNISNKDIVTFLEENNFYEKDDFCVHGNNCYLLTQTFSLCQMDNLLKIIQDLTNKLKTIKGEEND